jgi:hypothetical protein
MFETVIAAPAISPGTSTSHIPALDTGIRGLLQAVKMYHAYFSIR